VVDEDSKINPNEYFLHASKATLTPKQTITIDRSLPSKRTTYQTLTIAQDPNEISFASSSDSPTNSHRMQRRQAPEMMKIHMDESLRSSCSSDYIPREAK